MTANHPPDWADWVDPEMQQLAAVLARMGPIPRPIPPLPGFGGLIPGLPDFGREADDASDADDPDADATVVDESEALNESRVESSESGIPLAEWLHADWSGFADAPELVLPPDWGQSPESTDEPELHPESELQPPMESQTDTESGNAANSTGGESSPVAPEHRAFFWLDWE